MAKTVILGAARTPFGKMCQTPSLLCGMLLLKSAYWKMNSFSPFDPSTQLWFRLIELNLFVLWPQLLGADRGFAPYGWSLVFRP